MALPGGVKQMAITLVAISVLKKVDQEDPRVIAVCRVMFVVYMAISLSVQLYIRACILAKKETAPVTVPPKPASPFAAFSEASAEASAATDAATSPKEGEEEVDATVDATAGTGGRKRRGGAAEPAAEPAEPEVLSTEEYDLSVLASVRRGLLFNALLLSVFHLKMGSLNPLVITSATGLARLMDEPLFQLHVLGRPAVEKLARPFKPEANPLMALLSGTPPEGAADEAEADADVAGGAAPAVAAAPAAVTAAGEAKGSATTTARRRKAGVGATRRAPTTTAAGTRKDK